MNVTGTVTTYGMVTVGSPTSLSVTTADSAAGDTSTYAAAKVGYTANVGEGNAGTAAAWGTTTLSANIAAGTAGSNNLAGLASLVSKTNGSAFNSTINGVGVVGTQAQILWGTTTSAGTVSMNWRNPTATDNQEAGVPLASDIVNLTGIANGTDYVVQMNYDPSVFTNSVALADNQGVYLATLNTETGKWVNAASFNGLTPDFVGAVAWNSQDTTPGEWGVNPTTNQAWAVVNYDAEFAVVPEPGTLALLGVAGLLLIPVLRRRKRA